MMSRIEVIKGIEGYVGENIDTLLKPVESSWQPAELLPDLTQPGWVEHDPEEIWQG